MQEHLCNGGLRIFTSGVFSGGIDNFKSFAPLSISAVQVFHSIFEFLEELGELRVARVGCCLGDVVANG